MRNDANAEGDRLRKKAEREAAAQNESLIELASILEPIQPSAIALDGDSDPLLAACAVVGSAAGIRIIAPPRDSRNTRDPLGEIARASRIRTRPVVLTGDWWGEDNGPLLGTLREGATPVALLPRSSSSYVIHDPLRRTETPVTAANMDTLEPAAVMFYRPFPNRALKAIDLLRFGTRSATRDLLTVLFLGLGAGFLGLAVPLAIGYLFGTVVPEAERGQLAQVAVALFVAAIGSASFTIAQNVALLRLEGRADAAINAAIIDRLLSLPVSFFRRFTAGDLASRALGISEMRRFLSGAVLTTLLASVFSLVNLALLFVYDSGLAIVAAAIVIVLAAASALAGRVLLRDEREVRAREGRLAGLVLELITGMSKLRVSAAEGQAFAHWAKAFAGQKRVAYRSRVVTANVLVLHSLAPVLSAALLFLWIARQGTAAMPVGNVLAFLAAFSQLLTAVLAMATTGIVMLSLVPVYERAQPILSALPEVDDSRQHPGALSGDIELSHVSFRYDPEAPYVLEDVSLRIRSGEFVAVVGPSGTGKSTLFRLLLGFESPERGAILYDGQDLQVLDVQSVRRQTGVVLQQSRLMAGDVYHNIVGTSPLTIDDAWEAARRAGLEDDIREMPMGMHTVVSEGGGTFSGGQKQRLMIARAIASRPRIVLFDEATSALDNRTQSIVSESLEALQATRIVIAHRLTTIVKADRIVVLAGGRIVQSGSYEQLMAEPGLFRELAGRQLA